jgi:hypothetical protein
MYNASIIVVSLEVVGLAPGVHFMEQFWAKFKDKDLIGKI